MKIRFVVLAFVLMSTSESSFCCECRISGSVSKYFKAADVVFLGKVIFADDDGSGKFTQQTYVHFSIEESFKGIPPDVRDTWADPGSLPHAMQRTASANDASSSHIVVRRCRLILLR